MAKKSKDSIWAKRIADQEESGLSVLAWCRKEKVTDSQYYYWKKKLKYQKQQSYAPVTWQPLAVVDAENEMQEGIAKVTIECGKAKVSLKGQISAETIETLLEVICRHA